MRHVELRLLWVQDVVKSGRIELVKIRGDGNLADHLTKPKTRKEMKEILDMVGAELVESDRKEEVRREHEERGQVRKSWADLHEEEEEERRGA